jgi:RimJ/RimL family protein N-acetyltransferase
LAGMCALSYRDIDANRLEDCELLARWYNDPSLKHLYSLFPDAQSLARDFTSEYVARCLLIPSRTGTYRNLMVLADGAPVGQATFEMDTPKLLTKLPHTAWLALIIGEAKLRQRRLGTRIVAHLERLAGGAGAAHIEIGVFEYNERALSFFDQLGYVAFERRAERAYWDGRLWSEIRLLKTL